MTDLSDISVEIIAEQVSQEYLRQRSDKNATDAIMYLRSLVGTDFDEAFHTIARRIGDNRKVDRLPE